ncbi:DUF3500 domain-containing protein [Alteromonas sp. PRIM-21]|uniref:DUF3500 domain-containing protein n=1 Tax=Alteromonas sp. PRIM-21 TaxID=1454978 RepID=UPI0022B98313|nr:DUF3500 domain-containing protein [Alteromonas sp. PRIM-21]
MNVAKRYKVSTSILAIALALSPCTFSQEHPKGPHPDGPPPPRPDTPETLAIKARMGDTSTLMGDISVPASTKECENDDHITSLICLTSLLKSTLSEDALSHIQTEYSVEEAKNWSNLPAGAFPDRPGIFLGELSIEQRGIVKAILKEAASETMDEGFDEMVQTLNADDYIGTISTDYKAAYSSYNGKLAFLGEPTEDGLWELYYGGHHFAFSNTYCNGKLIGATPSFRGIEPFPSFEMNGRENKPLLQERDAFAKLLTSLTSKQQEQATLKGTYRDIIAGPQFDDAIPSDQEGLAVSSLSKEQVSLLKEAIYTYVGDIHESEAKKYMEKYANEFDSTVIGFSGTTALNSEDDYVRVHGPSLWIEFSMQSNKSTNKPGNHPHSVWRDRQTDYGGQDQ